MLIQIIGSESGCDSCEKMRQNVEKAILELGLDAEIEKVSDLVSIVKMGIMTAPALAADGKLLFAGQVPTVRQIKRALKTESEKRSGNAD